MRRQFEAMRGCMLKNPAVFGEMLGDVEEASGALKSSSGSAEQQGGSEEKGDASTR